MKELTLKEIAETFELIDGCTEWFYDTKSGDFDFFSEFAEDDRLRFEDERFIALPTQYQLDEYSIMKEFAESISKPDRKELLSMALIGKGAFRRFKDVLDELNLTEDWYEYRLEAFIETSKEWCEKNAIGYTEAKNDS